MLVLKTNTRNFVARCFAFPLSIFMLFLIIHYGFKEPNNDHILFWKFKVIHLLYFMIAVVLFYMYMQLLGFLSVIKVEAQITSGEITLISIIKRETISIHDIKNYFDTIHRNGFKKWEGIILILHSKKNIQIAGQNILGVPEFKKYLVEKEIPCLGTRNMKFPFN
jgi:hypothetical protein